MQENPIFTRLPASISLYVVFCLTIILFAQVTASAGAVRAGFNANSLSANDDGSTESVTLGFTVNFFGTNYNSAFINNNGNITFNAPLSTYTLVPFGNVGVPVIAPFWADVDTRGSGSGIVRYGTGTVDGRNAFGVNWVNVGYFEAHTNKLNSFQLILIDRSDRAPGAFDVEFNYDGVLWETGDASGGTGGLGGSSARAGYSDGTANDYEILGSGVNGGFLNSNPSTGLINNSKDSSVLGRYVFQFPTQARVTSVTYEQIATDDLLIDANPNSGGGRRIFPDDKVPDDPVDRRKIRVKAQYGQNIAGVRVYFRTFDLDDPSANAAPVDNEATLNAGDDNNGNVDGIANTRAGLLSFPSGSSGCQTFTKGISYLTNASGVATVDFTTTMQPGDNFTVAASANESYLTNLTLAVDGINLKDTNSIQIPVTTVDINACTTSNVRACRADMLTVWRRLHIEVDSMGNVGSDNKVEGTITNTGYLQGNCANTGPTPTPTPTPGPGPTPTPCVPDATGFFVQPDQGQPIDDGRFQNGRIVVGKRSFFVRDNTSATVILRGVNSVAAKTSPGARFTLYDDDDYNEDHSLDDGDFNESIARLPESFRYVTSEDGTHSDGNLRNVFASAYIRPEYEWAESSNHNQTNLAIPLNVSESTVSNVLSLNRNTVPFERNEFWISYILIAYQGDTAKDGDGETQAGSGIAPPAPATNFCDCYQATTCIGTSCSILPIGGQGALVYQEVMQDSRRTFLRLANLSIKLIGTTVPHEIGHQFGLMGDNRDPITLQPTRLNATYKIMDYPNRPTQTDEFELHPEHLNLLRKRVKSPGH